MFDLNVKNFRGFVDQNFQFRKINVLIGENSGGKSSLMKLLLTFKQSCESRSETQSNLQLYGKHVDIGRYRDIIHNHEVRRHLKFSFTLGAPYWEFVEKSSSVELLFALVVSDGQRPDEKISERRRRAEGVIHEMTQGLRIDPVVVDVTIGADLASPSSLSVHISHRGIGEVSMTFKNKNDVDDPPDLLWGKGAGVVCDLIFKSNSYGESAWKDIPFHKLGFLTYFRPQRLQEIVIEGKKNKVEANLIWMELNFLLASQTYLERLFSSIKYVNPLRAESAARVYLSRDNQPQDDIVGIEDLIRAISGKNGAKLKARLNKACRELGIADEIDVREDEFTKELKATINGMENNIQDVGFGTSLQLPILAQTILGRNSMRSGIANTLLIDQPEVHLHPKLQARFIDVLLQNAGNQNIVIETHSEHIVRMLQLIVKENRHGIKPEDVCIQYFRRNSDGHSVTLHEIDENGRLSQPFPDSFYDVSYDLAMQLLD